MSTIEDLERARKELRVRRLELHAAIVHLADPPTLADMARVQQVMDGVKEMTSVVRRLMREAA